jgi:hypothetical protein
MRGVLWLTVAAALAMLAQVPQPAPRQIDPSTLAYYSYSPVPQAAAPAGTEFRLVFPGQTGGSQRTPAACATYAALRYNHFSYDQTAQTWSANPLTGAVMVTNPTVFGTTRATLPGWVGLEANVAFEGALGSNSSPSTQNFVQSVYWSQDPCFEWGPEFGFYRLLTVPGNQTEMRSVIFYYALNPNCFNVGTLGSCRDKQTGQSLVATTVTRALTVPAANSKQGTNFVYRAVVSAGLWQLTVSDPYTHAAVASGSMSIDPAGFFGPSLAALQSTGLTGYITYTQQRASTAGGITDSMPSPLRLTVYSLAQLAVITTAAPTLVSGMQPATGWCMQGGQGIYAPSTTGGTPTLRQMQQSYPRCSVAVYQTGTTNLAPIFSNNGNPATALANPFQSNANGFWQFFAANGIYDVQISGGGLAAPLAIGSKELFDFSSWSPALFTAGTIGVTGANARNVYVGFTAPPLNATTVWTLPAADAAGCLASNGSGQLYFVAFTAPNVCGSTTPPSGGGGGGGGGGTATAAGSDKQIQYNKTGAFGADANFTWDYTAQSMALTGKSGIPALVVSGGGFVQSNGGFISSVGSGSWQGIQSNTDGLLMRGLHVAPNTAATAGGYINLGPLMYGTPPQNVNQPAPLPGLNAFGTHTGLIWVSQTNAMPADTSNSLNTNLYVNAAGGFATENPYWNSIQANAGTNGGGMFANSFTASHYVQVGHSTSPPPPTGPGTCPGSGTAPTGCDTYHQGALYWDDGIAALQVFNGTAWVSVGGGGGAGNPATPVGSIQFNAGGVFGGSANIYRATSPEQLVVRAASNATAGIVNLVGYVQAEQGLLAQNVATPSAPLEFNAIQAPTGGMEALSFHAINYMQMGNHAGVPPFTTGISAFQAGAMYFDTSLNAFQVFNGTTWTSPGGGGAAGNPAGTNTQVEYNKSGVFGADANLVWDYTNQEFTVTGKPQTPAVAVANGFLQSQGGFISAVTGGSWNGIQSDTDGSLIRGVHIAPNTPAANAGGYINMAPLIYGGSNATQPAPLPGLTSFGAHTGLLWVSQTNGMAPDTTYGMNTNLYMDAAGGFATQQPAWNAIQANAGNFQGGMYANSFTAQTYVQLGHHAGNPPPTGFGCLPPGGAAAGPTCDMWHQGMIYWDDNLHALQVYTDSNTWVGVGGGASGNFVTVDTAQTITGAKTFTTSDVVMSGIQLNLGGGNANTGTFLGLPRVTFAALGTMSVRDGGALWCTDCTPASSPCQQGPPNGAIAVRNAGAGGFQCTYQGNANNLTASNGFFMSTRSANPAVITSNGDFYPSNVYPVAGNTYQLGNSGLNWTELFTNSVQLTVANPNAFGGSSILGPSGVDGRISINPGPVLNLGSVVINGHTHNDIQAGALVVNNNDNCAATNACGTGGPEAGANITIAHGSSFDAGWAAGASAAFDVVGNNALTHQFVVLQGSGNVRMNGAVVVYGDQPTFGAGVPPIYYVFPWTTTSGTISQSITGLPGGGQYRFNIMFYCFSGCTGGDATGQINSTTSSGGVSWAITPNNQPVVLSSSTTGYGYSIPFWTVNGSASWTLGLSLVASQQVAVAVSVDRLQ